MKTNVQPIDQLMLQALRNASPHRLGMPAWMIKHLLTREEYPVKAASILGTDEHEDTNTDLLQEYENKQGYQFSWGTVSETSYRLDENIEECETGGTFFGTFEISPEVLFEKLPDPGYLEEAMFALYKAHPLRHPSFIWDESRGDWYTTGFICYSEEEMKALRSWMADVYIPQILPDIMARCQTMAYLGWDSFRPEALAVA